jgi:hypothetical protein
MSTSSTWKTVARTTSHVEYAMKWSDVCVAHVLGEPFTWSSREIQTTGILKPPLYSTEKGFYPWEGRLEITGKIGPKRLIIIIFLRGTEDSNDLETAATKDSTRGQSRLFIECISVTINPAGEDFIHRDLTAKDIPGYLPTNLVSLVNNT